MAGSGTDGAARDRQVLRRAGVTGLGVWLLLALVLAPALRPGGGAVVLAGVSWALAAGTLVAAGWASLALALDLVRDRPPGRARARWTLALVLLAVVAPLFAAAATTVS